MIRKLPFLACFFMYLGIFAQETELFKNEWFLTEITENGAAISLPDNDKVSSVALTFDFTIHGADSIPNLNTTVCNYLSSELEFTEDETAFKILSPNSSLVVCQNFENQKFENAYFSFFETEGAYNYFISEENNAKTLLINSPNGTDSAIYTSTNLSTVSIEKNKIQLYPSPAKNTLYLRTAGVSHKELKIYSIAGNQITSFEQQGNVIDISELSKGVYFLLITNGKQQQYLKFIKQ